MMFRNKIVVRAGPPSAASPFILRQLSLLPDPSLPPSSLASIDVEILCWTISRRWRIACFSQSSAIFIIYQRAQSMSVHCVLEELVQAVPGINIGMEEEVESAPLIAKAVEIGLRMFMLDHSWTCVGDSTFVDSTFAGSEEKKHIAREVCRNNLLMRIVHPDTDDGLVLLASPEVLSFSRYKVTDLVSSIFWRRFNEGEQVMLEDYNAPMACTIIPTLCEGHAIGVCKVLPNEENFEKLGLLLSLKHGLTLKSDLFISVQLAYGSDTSKWFPASYILQGHGFSPAPQTIRSLKAKETTDSFLKLFGDWDFFNQGQLKVKEILPLGIGTYLPVWIKATNHLSGHLERNKEIVDSQISFADISLLSLDFRTPKPGIWFDRSNRKLQNDNAQKIVTCRSSTEPASTGVNISSTNDSLLSAMKDSTCSSSIDLDRSNRTWKPSFIKRKVVEVHKRRISSSQLSDSYFAKKKQLRSEVVRTEDPSQRSKFSSGKKEKNDALLGSNISNKSEKEALVKISGKKPHNTKKISSTFQYLPAFPTGYKFHKRENPTEDSKTRAGQFVDNSAITEKVMNCYRRGELQALTVSELKCFLTSRKAKVGGRKEELIKRVASLLS